MRVLQISFALIASLVFLSGCNETSGLGGIETSRSDIQFGDPNRRFQTDVQVGDPSSSYASVEFTKDGRYMVWYEGVGGNRTGKMWHCAIDANTGAFDPPDCKGFSAFPTSIWGRANVGYDSRGPYYVGANVRGEVFMVRPTGATSGDVTKLPTPADPHRKGYYPTQILDREGGYVVWVKMNGRESRVLQYIDLADPDVIRTVETQYLGGRLPLTPMEIGFFRVVNGETLLTYGSFDENRKVQVKMKDLTKPGTPARFVTREPQNHVDPYGFVDPRGDMYLVSGIDAKALMNIYKYNRSTGYFEKQGEIRPPSETSLAQPSMASSFEPIFKGGRIYGAYQVNDGGPSVRGYISTSFEQPGEIWLVDIANPSGPQVKLSGTSRIIRTEPEPIVGSKNIWMFYNAAQAGASIMDATWQLRRSAVPLD